MFLLLSLVASQLFGQMALASGPLALNDAALAMPASLASRIQAATFQMENETEQSTCTAFAVTPDGYLLTALHCVRECLLSQNAGEQGKLPSLGLNDLFVVKNPAAVKAHCDEIKIKALGQASVDVIAAGPALAIYDAIFALDSSFLRDELSSRGFDRKGNDFALLKIKPAKALACFPIGAPAAQDTIFAVGFPLEEGKDVGIRASTGRVYGRAEESRYWQARTTPFEQKFVSDLYGDAGIIYSDASNDWGQSGGPIVGKDGRVLGVVSGFTTLPVGKNDAIHELAGSTLPNVLNVLPSDLAQTIRAGNARCR